MIRFILLICFLVVVTQPARSAVESILGSRNAVELDRAVVDSKNQKIQHRACEIQRREGLAPTACYALIVGGKNREHLVRALDQECLRRASSAERVPAVDEFTSTSCRRAIEARSLDLAYAEHRDALRYP